MGAPIGNVRFTCASYRHPTAGNNHSRQLIYSALNFIGFCFHRHSDFDTPFMARVESEMSGEEDLLCGFAI